jgi:hypothetical protein
MAVRPGQLDQAERVALRLGQDPVPCLTGQLRPAMLDQERRRRGRVQPTDLQLGQARSGERRVVVTCGEDDRDRLGAQAAGREHQRLGRGPVQPLCVVDQAHQRSVLGELGQQRSHRQPDQEAVAGPGTL